MSHTPYMSCSSDTLTVHSSSRAQLLQIPTADCWVVVCRRWHRTSSSGHDFSVQSLLHISMCIHSPLEHGCRSSAGVMEGPVTTPAVRRPYTRYASTQTCDDDLDSQDADAVLFAARLHDLSLAAPAVAHYIFRRVPKVRGACRLLRSAVNNTVGALSIVLDGEGWVGDPGPLELTSGLGASFPNATDLCADFSRASCAMELAHALTGLPELCPTLLPRLQYLSLDLCADHLDSELCIDALNTLLSRYSSSLDSRCEIHWQTHVLSGKGLPACQLPSRAAAVVIHQRLSAYAGNPGDWVIAFDGALTASNVADLMLAFPVQ
jgi:hypothetical protein